MPGKNLILAIYKTHNEVEESLRELQQSGFDLAKISILGKAYISDEQIVGCYTTGGKLKAIGGLGAFWEEIWNILKGAAFFFIPGIGPVVIAGSLVDMIISTLKVPVATRELSALGIALNGLGIPNNTIFEYEVGIRANKFILIASGTSEEIAKAQRIVDKSSTTEIVVQNE
jgi:hypothetical protein